MPSLDDFRRRAKALRKSYIAGDADALERVRSVLPERGDIKHTDALHVIAREAGFASWPKLKFNIDAMSLDRAAKLDRLKLALYHGQHWMVDAILSDAPDLARADLAVAVALYDIEHIRAVLAKDPGAALRSIGGRRPLIHLAFSQHIHGSGSKSDMLAVARALRDAGADVNDVYMFDNDPEAPLSALYGAVGYANNMPLAAWFLDQGADPDDNESLYHATELGHHDGLRLLLAHGATVDGTNALLRAMDFNDHDAVRMLLAAGGDPNFGFATSEGQPSGGIRALHQAARRNNDAQMAQILLDAGADPTVTFDGLTPYELARVYGNAEVAAVLERAGGAVPLRGQIARLARIADGEAWDGRYLDPTRLPDELRNMVRAISHQPDVLDHIRRLIAAGMEWDRPDDMGVTPVQIAGWEGLPEVMAYFLSLKPDLGHVNGYGGTLLSTIVHGSENCPERHKRDHIACARLALEEGVALPRRAPSLAGQEEMAAFLSDWAERYPGQVVERGPRPKAGPSGAPFGS